MFLKGGLGGVGVQHLCPDVLHEITLKMEEFFLSSNRNIVFAKNILNKLRLSGDQSVSSPLGVESVIFQLRKQCRVTADILLKKSAAVSGIFCPCPLLLTMLVGLVDGGDLSCCWVVRIVWSGDEVNEVFVGDVCPFNCGQQFAIL